MAYKISIGIDWQGKLDYQALCEKVQIAEAAGVHSAWVPEAWGRDAFTILTLLADKTKRINLGTAIVNTYSRTPAALAQHFATLDEVSGGRMLLGLGTSGPQVIEHFHGVAFQPPLQRMREYVEIINTLMKGEPLKYSGKAVRPATRLYIALPARSRPYSDLSGNAECQERENDRRAGRRLVADYDSH